MVKKQIRKCGECNLEYRAYKRSCYNALCKVSKPYKENKKKLKRQLAKEAKEEKKIIKDMINDLIKKIKIQKKMDDNLLKVPPTGVSAKGRNGSTRNGLVTSMSLHHSPELTVQEIKNRNALLQVANDVCFWCKTEQATVLDHAHPCCSMVRSEFSWTNSLNIFPCCRECNQTKGCKPLLGWLSMNVVASNWSSEQITTFKNWLSLNKPKLMFNEKHTNFTVRQFQPINHFHLILEHCAKYKVEVEHFISFKNMQEIKMLN
tara:strand:+ start:965 stop:1747 length:783 start_codon:yes stop_codon:yes gene_type:complete